MLKRVVLIAALVIPQVASAADLGYRHHDHHGYRHAYRHHPRVAERNNVIHCTTSNFFLFSSSSCGQGFDPLSVSGI